MLHIHVKRGDVLLDTFSKHEGLFHAIRKLWAANELKQNRREKEDIMEERENFYNVPFVLTEDSISQLTRIAEQRYQKPCPITAGFLSGPSLQEDWAMILEKIPAWQPGDTMTASF